MLPPKEFDRLRESIARLPTKAENERYEKSELLCKRFLLFSEAGLDVYYVPFHYMNRKARVVLIGLTPGWTQMEEAFRAAKRGLSDGLDGKVLFRFIETTGSFSGPMRNHLVSMLDGIGLNKGLGVTSCVDLFGNSSHLVHYTSAVSAPIFRRGENYRGSGPPLLQVPRLQKWIVNHLAKELASLPDALVIPLGKVAGEVVEFLQSQNLISGSRFLHDFPHPSGANGHRKPLYERGRERWRRQLRTWFGSRT
jgi:hypothetical protein